MADISKCRGMNCMVRMECYRYMADEGMRQSWADFDSLEKCHYFWPVHGGAKK